MKQLPIILVFMLVSCDTDNSDAKPVPIAQTDTVSNKTADTSFAGFTKFWGEFRRAVLDFDTTKIISLTKFPFETQGEMDSDPIVRYEPQEFVPIFKAYLQEELGQREKDSAFQINALDLIRRTEQPDLSNFYNGQIYIGDLQFGTNSGKWKLQFALLQTRNEILFKGLLK